MTKSNLINRRDVLAAMGASSAALTAATAAKALAPAAAAPSPRERIDHLLAELQEAFRDYYPGVEIHGTFNETPPERACRPGGGQACLMVFTGSTKLQAFRVE